MVTLTPERLREFFERGGCGKLRRKSKGAFPANSKSDFEFAGNGRP
jgi:hypothetical protein